MSFSSPLEWYWVIAPLAVAVLAALLIVRGLFHLGYARFAPAGLAAGSGVVLGLIALCLATATSDCLRRQDSQLARGPSRLSPKLRLRRLAAALLAAIL